MQKKETNSVMKLSNLLEAGMFPDLIYPNNAWGLLCLLCPVF